MPTQMKCLDCGYKFFTERGTEMTIRCPKCGSGHLKFKVPIRKQKETILVEQEQKTPVNL